MEVPRRLINYLNANKVEYEILHHDGATDRSGRTHQGAASGESGHDKIRRSTFDAIIMSYRDYEKIVKPKVEDLAVKLQPMKGV